jgi:presenilin-like A22 family membrane protease
VTLALLLLVLSAVGTHYVIDAFRALPPLTFVVALIIVSLATFIPRVITHDLGIVFGVAGISALVGVTMTPAAAAAIMLGTSVYDLVSVYRGQMLRYAGHMMESGAIFGFIIPSRISGFFMRRDRALKNSSVILLGSADVGMPLLLASAAANTSIAAAFAVAVGAFVGLIVVHYLLSSPNRSGSVAALPPIVSTSILGYIVAVFLGL